MKKVFFSIVISFLCLGLVACTPKVDPALSPIGFTKEQKIEDFEYLCKLMDELYPFWNEVAEQGIDKDALNEKYQKLVKKSGSDVDFLNLMQQYFGELQSGSLGHLWCIDAASYSYMVNLYSSVSGRAAWISLLKNDITANTYGQFASDENYNFIPIAPKEPESAEDTSSNEDTSQSEEYSFHTKVINDGKTGYIRIPTFDNAKIAEEAPLIQAFMKEITQLPNLILDIRGNGGGNDAYWMSSIVSPNIQRNKTYSMYYLFKENIVSNELANPFMNERHPNLKAIGQPISALPEFEKLSKSATDFDYFTFSTNTVPATFSASPYTGKIWILTDGYNGSAAASFIDFCAENDFATQVGSPSGGDNCNGDPTLFALPNSGLVIRFDLFYGLNPDGTSNAVSGMRPDIMCKSEDALEVCLKEINQAA